MKKHPLKILPIPSLVDNYAYLCFDERTRRALVVDPSEAPPVRQRLQERGLTLEAILATHRHGDHIGGVPELLGEYPKANAWMGELDKPKGRDEFSTLSSGERLNLLGREIEVLGVPCHTRGHVAYFVEGALFTGDTLFGAGCGRFFEGEAAEMVQALYHVFGALPGETKVYFGHEYTHSNLCFARHILPEDEAIKARVDEVERALVRGEGTTPSTLQLERRTNPFLLVHTPELQERLGARDLVEAMAALRAAKNRF